MLSYRLSQDTPVLPRGDMGYQIIIVIMLIKKILEKVSKLVELSLFYKADKYERPE